MMEIILRLKFQKLCLRYFNCQSDTVIFISFLFLVLVCLVALFLGESGLFCFGCFIYLLFRCGFTSRLAF